MHHFFISPFCLPTFSTPSTIPTHHPALCLCWLALTVTLNFLLSSSQFICCLVCGQRSNATLHCCEPKEIKQVSPPPPLHSFPPNFKLPSPNPLRHRPEHTSSVLSTARSMHTEFEVLRSLLGCFNFFKGISTFLSPCQVKGTAGDTNSKEAIRRG